MDISILWVNDHVACATDAHTHEFYQLIYCRQKGGKITVGDKIYDAKSNFVYLAKPGDLHATTVGSQMRLIEIKFKVNDNGLNKNLEKVPREFQLDDVILMKTLLLQAAKEGMRNSLYSLEAANAALKLFLLYAARQFNPDLNGDSEDNAHPEISGDANILRLAGYIDKNFGREITLEELADRAGYNKTYFVKKFKMIWGMSPMQFVNERRLEKAKLMLASTDRSITEIAESTGFVCIHAFSRNFKRNLGITPSEYRRKY